MNRTFRYTLLASALMLAGPAQAARIIDFDIDTTAVTGSTRNYQFTADEMTWTSIGTSTVEVTDASGDGTLDGIDAFFELGAIDIVNFKDDGLAVPGTGLGRSFPSLQWQFMVDFTFTGFTHLTPSGELRAVFTGGGGNFWYDEDGGSTIEGNETKVATFANPRGECYIRNGYSQGDCKLRVEFTSIMPGFITDSLTGDDLVFDPTDPFWMVVDVNVDELIPALKFVYPGGPGSTQTVALDHDGSARFIPEPGVLALLGIGTLGLAGMRRKAS